MEIIIVAGANGSGKSTLASQLDFNCEFINADKYEKVLLSHIADKNERELRAGMIVANEIKSAISANKSFAFETVFSTKEIPSFLKTAKQKGYKITLHYISTSAPEINIERVATRVRQGGHDVPRDKIIERYNLSTAILPRLIEFADNAIIYDNSTKLQSFLIKENNEIKTIGETPQWATKILPAC